MTFDAREHLRFALVEFRDAGLPASAVVDALDAYLNVVMSPPPLDARPPAQSSPAEPSHADVPREEEDATMPFGKMLTAIEVAVRVYYGADYDRADAVIASLHARLRARTQPRNSPSVEEAPPMTPQRPETSAPEPVAWLIEFNDPEGSWKSCHLGSNGGCVMAYPSEEAARQWLGHADPSAMRAIPLVRADTALAAARERIAGELEDVAMIHSISDIADVYRRAAEFVRASGASDER